MKDVHGISDDMKLISMICFELHCFSASLTGVRNISKPIQLTVSESTSCLNLLVVIGDELSSP